MVSNQFQLNVFIKYSSIHIAEYIYIISYSLESIKAANCLFNRNLTGLHEGSTLSPLHDVLKSAQKAESTTGQLGRL